MVDNKRLVKEGDVIKNEKYAKTLERVRDDPESFYNGALASDIIRDLKKVNGMVTDSDLRDYRPITRDPYQRELSGMKMYLTPPPTSGAVLGLILNILQGRSSRHCDQYSPYGTYSSPSLCTHSSSRLKNDYSFVIAWKGGGGGGCGWWDLVTMKFTRSLVTFLRSPPVPSPPPPLLRSGEACLLGISCWSVLCLNSLTNSVYLDETEREIKKMSRQHCSLCTTH